MRPPVRNAGNQMMSMQSERLQHLSKEPAFEQLLALHGEGADVADIRDDIRCRHRALCVVRSQLFQELRLVSEHEQLVVLHVPHIVYAYAARRAFAQVGDLSAGVRPCCGSSAQS